MATKLVSANMGIVLIVEKDGKQEKMEWSVAFPSEKVPQPHDAVFYLNQFLEEAFGTDIQQVNVPIAKPKRIKAKRPISHDEFNQKITALVP